MALIGAGSLIAGRYQLEARLDAGGRAQVWRASDQELNRPVAIKLMLTPTGGDQSFLDAFRAEAQLEARMRHPAIVEVFDWGHDGDANYVVMELLEGQTVRRRLDQGPMAPDRVVALGLQTAAALVYAHALGVAHGSIGPDHVIVAPEGAPTLIDFGRQCRGTCEYTALPDVDTYALGAMLYEALVGASPTGPRPVNVSDREQWPTSPHKLNSDIPIELDRVVMKAVSPDQGDRYRTAAELLAALEELTEPRSRTWLWALLTVLAVVIALAGVWFFTSQNKVVVPDLVGMSSEQAQSTLSSAGLTMVVTARVPSADLPSGAVVSEDPAAGVRVHRGSQVAVTVSTGKPTATVPSVTGAGVEAASSALTSAGLVVGTVTTKESSTFATDTVMSQSPAAGVRVTTGTAVDLVVSVGRTLVTVPDVHGMTQADATTKLEDAGFAVDSGTAFSTQPSGVVISQGPAAGTSVPKASTVSISVSKGAAPVDVPDVVGAQAADAKASLQNLGLVPVSVLTSGTPSQVGNVISQTPVNGTKVSAGSQVEIVIGK